MNQSLSLIIDNYRKNLESTIENFKEYLLTLKIGQATPHILDPINIKQNNRILKIKHLANISIRKPNTIIIKPWDKENIKVIEKAILEAPSHFIPNHDGNQILIKIPELNRQDRLKIFKELKKRGENSKISIRKSRRDFNNLVKVFIKNNNLSSNLERTNLLIIQKMTNDITNKIDTIIELKKNDIINI